MSIESLEIKYNPYRENMIIVGESQEGKTNTAFQIAKALTPNYNFIIYTPQQYSNLIKLNPQCVIHNVYDIKGRGLEIVIPQIATEKFFNDLCIKVFSLNHVVFMMDELHNYVTKQKIPKPLQILVENCNNRDIGYIGIFQRPQRVENSILANSNHRICYMLELPSDVKYMTEWLGIDMQKFTNGEMQKYHGLYKKKGELGSREIYFPCET